MAVPIRASYRQNADHFFEGQAQFRLAARPLISEKAQRRFFLALILATVTVVSVREGIKRQTFLIPFLGALFCLLMMGFWFWLFKKIGLDRLGSANVGEPTEKDRLRVQKTFDQIAEQELLVSWEFDEIGVRFTPVTEKSANYSWSTIFRVVETPRGLVIFINRIANLWFPKTAFASAGDYEDLCRIITARIGDFQRLNASAWAYVALGSNLGEPKEQVLKAMGRLERLSDKPLLKSTLWQTTPVDCPPGSPGFVNAVVALIPRVGETPESLLEKLRGIEREFGRRLKQVMNEPRPLDLDLISFGQERRNSPELTLPHPRASGRKFVLAPLAEIAPDLVLPGENKAVAELLNSLPVDDFVQKLA